MDDTQLQTASIAEASPVSDAAIAEPVRIDHDVGVIGAGFAGLIAGLQLREHGGRSFIIFERAGEVGGVWRDNIYPGCACDVRSHLYSISSQPNPEWRSNYAPQPEILAYLQQVVAQGRLQRHIRFDTDIVEARFLEDQACWRLADGRGGLHHVRALILASGPVNRATIPTIPGLQRFAGTYCHSSAWTDLDLTGKRVAVVGTGASAVQIVPNIVEHVGYLTVFQRSAAWVLPRRARVSSAFERWLFRRAPGAQKLVRSAIYWTMETVGLAFFGNRTMNRLLRTVALRKLAREVRDPATRRALTPKYEIGCKRMTVSDDFLPAFNRDNVALTTEPIAEITAEGVLTRDGMLHRLDHIVFATGFVVADADRFLRVVGAGGRVLPEEWAREGAQAYRGVTVSGYPNFAMLLGPNSGLSYSSVIDIAEVQMRYILAYLDSRDVAGADAVLDVKPQVQVAYNQGVQAQLKGTVWDSGCRSWYIDRAGRNAAIWPWPAHHYRRQMARFDPEDYEIQRAGARSEAVA